MVELRDLKTIKKNTWCPGCGNFSILNSFKRAIIQLGLKREEVVAVSGIGCHGKMTGYLNINGFHTIHGRVLPTAAGVKDRRCARDRSEFNQETTRDLSEG